MKLSGLKAVAVAAAALTPLGVGSTTSAAAASHGVADCQGDRDCRTELRPVLFSASQASINILQMQLENLHATALDAHTGQPLAGKRVQFHTNAGRYLGSAYTNADGVAAITAPENFGPGTVQELLNGYNAILVGDGVYTPATAHGAITLGTDCGGGGGMQVGGGSASGGGGGGNGGGGNGGGA